MCLWDREPFATLKDIIIKRDGVECESFVEVLFLDPDCHPDFPNVVRSRARVTIEGYDGHYIVGEMQ